MHIGKTKEFINFKNEKILPDYFIIFSTYFFILQKRIPAFDSFMHALHG